MFGARMCVNRVFCYNSIVAICEQRECPSLSALLPQYQILLSSKIDPKYLLSGSKKDPLGASIKQGTSEERGISVLREISTQCFCLRWLLPWSLRMLAVIVDRLYRPTAAFLTLCHTFNMLSSHIHVFSKYRNISRHVTQISNRPFKEKMYGLVLTLLLYTCSTIFSTFEPTLLVAFNNKTLQEEENDYQWNDCNHCTQEELMQVDIL